MTYRLADEPRRHALERPDAPALTGRGSSLTYGELDQRTKRLANVLAQRGICPQSRVAVLDRSSVQVVEVLFASAKVGAVTVPVNCGSRRANSPKSSTTAKLKSCSTTALSAIR